MKSLLTCVIGVYLLVLSSDGRSIVEEAVPEQGENVEALTQNDDCQCDKRFLQHYDIKQCTPVYRDGCDCPIRYDCPQTFLNNNTVCVHHGVSYNYKDKIPSSNPCLMCSCERSFAPVEDSIDQEALDINCISVECPSAFRRVVIPEGCYQVFDKNKCCSVGVKCDNETADEPTCELDGKIYHLGQSMEPKDDECISCICDENWTGVQGSSCRRNDCMMEKNRKTLQSGCIPVYHESTCCPIEYHCKTGNEAIEKSVSYADNNASDPLNQCAFHNLTGNLGDHLNVFDSNNCVVCTCSTPPDFTCLRTRCPGPPNDDYDNCKYTYTPGTCCPTYTCAEAAPPGPVCEPVYCEEGCSEVFVPYGCSMCKCDDVLCSAPKCSPDCVIDYDSKPCPTCKCSTSPAFDFSKPMCSPVKCPSLCRQAMGNMGCPMCVCGPLCSPPKCPSGCHVQTDFADGECPGCACNANETSPGVPEIMCSPILCPPYCHEVIGDHGCPMCQCDPMCSPPKCDEGCTPEVVPSDGTCPGCVCLKHAAEELQCSPVKCPEGCSEYTPPNSCPMCQCEKLLCSVPACPEECEINYDVAPGTCPHCKCPDANPLARIRCSPVKCAPQCHEAVSPQGCPMCICSPLCTPPKCEDGCKLQTDVPDGECPGCDCPKAEGVLDEEHNIQCGIVNCPSVCTQATNQYGCPMCLCEPLCSPPKCDPGCHIDPTPSGPCPGCICDTLKPLCGPVKCGPNCYETISPQGCPMCNCRPQCSPPRCELGCQIQRDVPEDQCPGCDCSSSPLHAPSLPACPSFCKLFIDDTGATKCDCNMPVCDPPICPQGCHIETAPSEGPCPGCACDGDDTGDSTKVPEAFRWCPPVTCDEGCEEVMTSDEDRCPACKCGGQCVPPQCPDTCDVETDVPEGACPGCTCAMKAHTDLSCPDEQCFFPCRKVQLSPTTCPICDCIPPVMSGPPEMNVPPLMKMASLPQPPKPKLVGF